MTTVAEAADDKKDHGKFRYGHFRSVNGCGLLGAESCADTSISNSPPRICTESGKRWCRDHIEAYAPWLDNPPPSGVVAAVDENPTVDTIVRVALHWVRNSASV